jgi:hypothetical protein
MSRLFGVARLVQFEPGYKGPNLPDAVKFSGPGVAATPTTTYIPSFIETTGKHAADVKAAARYTQHGIIANLDDPSAPKVPDGKGYILTADEEAASVAVALKEKTRYVEHGIVMNSGENPLAAKK